MKCNVGTVRERLRNASPFYRGIVVLLGGSVAAQSIALLASPLLTRLYSPGSFGIAGIYLSVLGITRVACMLRYESAIPACAEDPEAAIVTCLSIFVAIVSSCFIALLITPIGTLVSRAKPQLSIIVPYLYWVPIGAVVACVYLALSIWAVRRQQYPTLSRTKLTQSFFAVCVQLGVGAIHSNPAGLIAGQVVGQSGGIGSLARGAWKQDGQCFRQVTFRKMLQAAKKYRRFPLMSVPAVGLDALFSNLPLLVIASLYGVVVAGWVTLVQRLIFVPALMVAMNIGQVVLGEMYNLVATDLPALERMFWQRLKQVSILGGIACILLAIAAPMAITLAFGKQWSNAAICAELLLPMVLGSMVSSVFGTALDVLQRQDLHLAREVGRFIILAVTMSTIYFIRPSWKGAVAIIGAMSAIAYLWYLFVSWWAIHYRLSRRRILASSAVQAGD